MKKAIETDMGDVFWFGDTLVGEIQDDVLYGGIRFRPLFKIGTPVPSKKDYKKLRRIYLDLSFQQLHSDMIKESTLNSELEEIEKISWKIYPLEYMVADKLHAIISRAGLSTRAKDLYDLYFILEKCDKKLLKKSILHTFEIRNMEIENPIVELLRDIETSGLERNWKRIESRENSPSFEDCLKKVLAYFEASQF